MFAMIQRLLSMFVSEKAAFALVMMTGITKAMESVMAGDMNAVVDFAYNYLPENFKGKASVEEMKAAVSAYVEAWQATENLFK